MHIEQQWKENVNFIWISGNNQPDFRTINSFRSRVVKAGIEVVFNEVPRYLIEKGYVTLENYFMDGTKIEANTNQYKWVWAKSTAKYKARLQEKIQELLVKIEQELVINFTLIATHLKGWQDIS
jgi:hypothetical protein